MTAHEFIATVDLDVWRTGGERAREIERAVDEGMQRAGFLLVTGHGIPDGLARRVRRAAREFFALDDAVKSRYSATIGERGWIGPGMEANGYAEGTETPPDLKETFAVGADHPVGVPEIDAQWFRPNVWPTEIAELADSLAEYTRHCGRIVTELLTLFAQSLNLDATVFDELGNHPTWTCNVNHYPPLRDVGEPEPGQFRIGPHTDFGTVTLLDREPGAGGLQVYGDVDGTGEERWVEAPYDPAALTVNICDLLEYWSGRRWRSGRHRVLPPQAHAPDEDLVSLVYFGELNWDAEVVPLAPPIGRVNHLTPVTSAQFIQQRLDAITVG